MCGLSPIGHVLRGGGVKEQPQSQPISIPKCVGQQNIPRLQSGKRRKSQSSLLETYSHEHTLYSWPTLFQRTKVLGSRWGGRWWGQICSVFNFKRYVWDIGRNNYYFWKSSLIIKYIYLFISYLFSFSPKTNYDNLSPFSSLVTVCLPGLILTLLVSCRPMIMLTMILTEH